MALARNGNLTGHVIPEIANGRWRGGGLIVGQRHSERQDGG